MDIISYANTIFNIKPIVRPIRRVVRPIRRVVRNVPQKGDNMSEGIVMPFGKHKGEYIQALPSSYLLWLAQNCDWNDRICEAADEEWQWRDKYNEHDNA